MTSPPRSHHRRWVAAAGLVATLCLVAGHAEAWRSRMQPPVRPVATMVCFARLNSALAAAQPRQGLGRRIASRMRGVGERLGKLRPTRERTQRALGMMAAKLDQSVKWVKAHPGKSAAIAVGGVAMVAASWWLAPIISNAIGGGMLGQATGGAFSAAARSLWVNGGMQLVLRDKVDRRELITDVSLSALGGGYGFALAHGMELGTKALQLTGLVKAGASAVGLGVIEATKDAYQISIRNKITGRSEVTAMAGARKCFPMETITNAIRIPAPSSFGLKTIADVVGAGLYHMIVNPHAASKSSKAAEQGFARD